MTQEGEDTGEEGMSDGRATIVDVARALACQSPRCLWYWAEARSSRSQPASGSARAMSELGYIYHRGAATLRGAKSGVLGMVINDLSNPFYVELAIGIEQACQGGAFIPFLANSAEDPIRQQAGHQVDARAWRGRAGACAGDRHIAERVKPLIAGHAGRSGDAPPSWPEGLASSRPKIGRARGRRRPI